MSVGVTMAAGGILPIGLKPSGPQLTSNETGKEGSFAVTVLGSHGRPMTTGGQDISCIISSKAGGSYFSFSPSIIDHSNGMFTIKYPALKDAGVYNVDLRLNDKPSHGSPFKLQIQKAANHKSSSTSSSSSGSQAAGASTTSSSSSSSSDDHESEQEIPQSFVLEELAPSISRQPSENIDAAEAKRREEARTKVIAD